MTAREQQYSAQLSLSSPQASGAQFPESAGSGDRATVRNVLSWCSSIVTAAGRKLGALDRVVWCALFGFADLASGSAYPALTTVSTLTGVSLRRVRLAVRALESVGLLRPQARPGRPTLYTLLLPPSSPLQTPARVARAQRSEPRHERRARDPGTSSSRPRQTPANTPARAAPQTRPKTPAHPADTPAREGRGPRHPVPVNVPKEENKSELLAGAHAQTPAHPADVDPGTQPPAERATASGCAPAPPTAPAEPENASDASSPVAALQSPSKGARSAQARALAFALAAHLATSDPGTRYPLAPPRPIEPDPGTVSSSETPADPGTSAPGKEPDTPPLLPPELAGVLGRVALLNRRKG